MPAAHTHRAAAVAALLLALTTPAAAQYVTRATFSAADSRVSGIDVAAAPDGTLLVLYNDPLEGKLLFSARFGPTGAFLGSTTVTAAEWADKPVVAATATGGFIGAWRQPVWTGPTSFRPGLFASRLDGLGEHVGKKQWVSATSDVFANAPSVVGLPSGSLVAWYTFDGIFMRHYSLQGTPLGAPSLIDAQGGESVLLPTHDGGYLLVYRRYVAGDLDGEVVMRAHGPSGELRAEATVSDDFDFTDGALAPAEDVAAAIGIHQPDPDLPATDIVLRRFTLDGVVLGTDQVVHSAELGVSGPQVAFDRFGNLLVTWGENGGVWARVLDAGATPLAPPVQVATKIVADYSVIPGLRTVRLAGGDFVNVWNDGEHAWMNFVTLCTPGSAVCGDGVHAVTCEACDDGAANDDTLPDACRTSCRRAGCGDGVIDSGESCDDGNTQSCDGCSAACAPEPGAVCGDGVISPGCEQCDDTNLVNGDGCADACTIERVRGGGSVLTDCYEEWRVVNPSNDPLESKKGGINPQQRCVDDDPRCDFDGGVPGGCTFRIAVCANNTNLAGCDAGERLLSWSLTKPSATTASARPALAAVRDAFAAVPAAIVGTNASDVCSNYALVPVPLRGEPGDYRSTKLTLGSRAELYDGGTDRDTMKLQCVPAAP